ncbi:MAG: hypothetical protein LBL15_05490, partial [Oscillospiraceae bacterium]|nr:hypothetical protein [Oscillospiraceae bacterium]
TSALPTLSGSRTLRKRKAKTAACATRRSFLFAKGRITSLFYAILGKNRGMRCVAGVDEKQFNRRKTTRFTVIMHIHYRTLIYSSSAFSYMQECQGFSTFSTAFSTAVPMIPPQEYSF